MVGVLYQEEKNVEKQRSAEERKEKHVVKENQRKVKNEEEPVENN